MAPKTKIQSFTCPGCGAALSIQEGQRYLRCVYCGRDVKYNPTLNIPPVKAPKSPSPHVPKRPQIPQTTPQQVPATRLILPVVIYAAVVLGVGFSLYFSLRGIGPGFFDSVVGERLQWVSHAQPPIPVSINGDAAEDLVGIYRVLKGSGSEHYVGAFDGANFKKLWSIGPFGDYGQVQHIQFALTRDHMLVTDYRMKAYIYELATGKELTSVSLRDRATQACSAPGNAEVWLSLADGGEVLVKLPGGEITPTPRPVWCPGLQNQDSDCWRFKSSAQTRCLGKKNAPKVDGFRVERVLQNGGDAVAVGVRTPGTSFPMLVGFTPGSKEVRFSRSLPQGDPLLAKERAPELVEIGHGRIYAQYEMNNDFFRLQASDAQSGEILWDVVIPDSDKGSEASSMALSPTRVYLPHWTWLDIFDAKTGERLGRIGVW